MINRKEGRRAANAKECPFGLVMFAYVPVFHTPSPAKTVYPEEACIVWDRFPVTKPSGYVKSIDEMDKESRTSTGNSEGDSQLLAFCRPELPYSVSEF